MTRALLYHPGHRWRFAVALGAAGVIHLAAISFANIHRTEAAPLPGVSYEPPEVTLEPMAQTPDPQLNLSDPLPTPPTTDQSFPEEKSTPPPVRRQIQKVMPFVKPKGNAIAGSLILSSAKVFANAPRPEYPYEAKRQKITGDGIVVMTIDPITGCVTGVTLSKSTGSSFLDNAALTGFKRWRFRPGAVSAVTCPVTFTLTGATY